MSDILHETLEKYWKYKSFRPLQEDIIRSVLAGNDTLGLMPTGGGKSLTFQVPTMTMEGLCIVITPLIALMKDQVDNLRARGIKATTVYSGMSREEIVLRLDNCIYGDFKFLYISPERINTMLFKKKLEAMKVCLLVVDESHCISQWGYDFRPSYLQIAGIRQLLPEAIPVLALTATATPEVVDDIQEKLEFREKNVFRKSFTRVNLGYIVRKTENKLEELKHILTHVQGTAIVYVRNRKRTQEIADELRKDGFSANFFHAGLNRDEKTLRQDAWKKDTCRIMVATNAFGMGIDKPDVRIVVHIDMPSSLEEYFQEAGRAGRDEKKAFAVALCSSTETAKLKKRISDEYPNKRLILRIYEALGNYYEIAVGFGASTSHNFPLQDFCQRFKLPVIQTHNALKILETAGYLEYEEYPDTSSRLLFTIDRDELYKIKLDELSENIIHTILRSYTGPFADYVFIDETLIATRTHSTREEVYNALINMSKMHIVSYIPQKQMPQIIFTRDREEEKRVSIPQESFENRLERTQKRIEKVIEYINEENICRTRLLLRYFGEKSDKNCRTCDICLRKNAAGLRNWEIEEVREKAIEILKTTPETMQALLEKLPFERKKNMQIIRFLIEHDKHIKLHDGILSFIQQ